MARGTWIVDTIAVLLFFRVVRCDDKGLSKLLPWAKTILPFSPQADSACTVQYSCGFAISQPACLAVKHLNLTRSLTGTVYTAAYWHSNRTVYVNVPILADTAVYIGTVAPSMMFDFGLGQGWDIIKSAVNGSSCVLHSKDLTDKMPTGKEDLYISIKEVGILQNLQCPGLACMRKGNDHWSDIVKADLGFSSGCTYKRTSFCPPGQSADTNGRNCLPSMGMMGNGTCPALMPFPQATEDLVPPASQSFAHQAAVNAALAARHNATLGPLPLLGEYPHGHITAKAQYGLGEAEKLAQATGTDPYTGLKLGKVALPNGPPRMGFRRNATASRGGAQRGLLQTGADTWRFVLGPDGQPANTGNIAIHATITVDNKLIIYEQGTYQSSSFDYLKGVSTALPDLGPSPFCGGNLLLVDGNVGTFGGSGGASGVDAVRIFNTAAMTTSVEPLYAFRWYPTVLTMPDGKVLVVGGSITDGLSGYGAGPADNGNAPTYQYYSPTSGTMSIAYDDMFTQLDEAWPLASFPFLAVLPTSEVIMMVGSLNALYTISPTTFNLVFSRNLPMRPDGIPWTYPQTGVAVLLPLDPANNYAVKVLSAGGCSQDLAGLDTPATNAAYIFDYGTAQWTATATPMTQPRVIGNVILLPTRQVLILNGAGTGTSGFGTGIGGGNTLNPVMQPELYDIATNSWSGPLAAATNPRLYHSTALLLPSGEVLVSGSEVTQDFTAEIYRPSYLSSPNQPFINMPTAPQSLAYGGTLQLTWGRTSTVASEDVDHGVLIRSGAITHSTHFDQRMVILITTSTSAVTSQSVGGLNMRSGTITVQMPPSNLVAPPGLYMLFLLGKDNTPSPALYVSLGVPVPANAPQPPQDSGVGYNLYANTAYATGSDLFNFYCAGGQCLNVYDCATYCKNTARCAAFTYTNGMCNLKSAATAQIAVTGAFAGLITQSNVNAPPYVDPCDAGCKAAFAVTQNSDYFGNNIQGSPITNAATADECQYACYMRTNCRAYTFTITGYCYFKSAATNLVANAGFVTGAKTTGTCDATCQASFKTLQGQDYNGNDLPGTPVLGVNSEDGCLAACYTNLQCAAFTFLPIGNLCYIKSAAANLRPAEADWITGAKVGFCNAQCQAAFQTSTGYDHFGNDLPGNPVAASSASACQTACFMDTDCNAYTYIGSEAGCYLKSAAGNYITAPADYTTGAKIGGDCDAACESSFSVVVGSDYYGNDLPGVPFPSATAEQCQEACYLRSGCQAFTFVGVNGCYLKSAAGTLSPSYGYFTTGARLGACSAPCQAAFTTVQGHDYFGNNLPNTSTDFQTAAACQSACYATPQCQAFTFTGPGGCYLKSAAANYIAANINWTTGARLTSG